MRPACSHITYATRLATLCTRRCNPTSSLQPYVPRRGLDEWTRERIDFVTDDEIFNGGYFLEHFAATDLFTTLGGTRDPAELQGTTVPGFWQQPETEVDPELLFDWRKTPLPPAVQALSKLALEQAKRKKARR